MTYLLGIDGGNSKTLAMLADQTGRVLGIGRAGCGNHQATDLDAAMHEIRKAAHGAIDVAGHHPDAAFYALAGADLEIDFETLRAGIERAPLAPSWWLDNDVIAAERSGTDNPNAVVVVVGSGANAAGHNDRGKVIRLAGIGWKSGDWGGGGDLAEEAVRLSIRAWDGRGVPTRMQEMILRALELDTVEELISRLHIDEIRASQLIEVVPLILQAADSGDTVAAELVHRAGVEVATTAVALLRRLDLLDSTADVVLGGGVFRSESPLLLDVINDGISAAAPDVRIVLPGVEPAVGAVICAMEHVGIAVSGEIRSRLAATSKSLLSGA